MKQRVAFIGLGNMGGPMAANLLSAGFAVSVFDLSDEACKVLAGKGASVAESAKAAADSVDFLITMLPAGKHVAGLYLGDDGLLSMLDASTTVLDCSTIDAQTAREVGEAAAARDIGFLDAPVSGGVAAAQAGTLAFMCGGDAKVFETAQAVLNAMGRASFHAGPAGAGQVAKACNNMLLAVHMLGTCEALAMGKEHGLDPARLSEIMLASSGRNWSLEVYNPWPDVMEGSPASNNYQPGFMVDLMAKDLGLAMDVAKTAGIDNSMGQLAQTLYEEHQGAGNGARDFSSVLERYRQK
ncbi:3-hydroxyisobutyrate dehydrogenase [Congregibacter litoralis]|uniref:3-hydroxyisobutyrate dehydrogenase n=1 Tax=Congregibacter litoralis KT71 TaxID=314285 RepID=A4AC39_9GAMM|nr:3-hydroxyisobutyrate dehydrogenase [Congregibacter litoralis]EAQ96489.1 3-hydroxyisobutyrate dehydrogenase [Congregibacter litoralis KT71]